ncbi:V-type ATP synthase subunit A [Cyanobium sp. Copco_Reservoir_LC18]|nr:V-type ATP synthase subunit A [Cyanobium sp. Copco_Reservoir_LC18]
MVDPQQDAFDALDSTAPLERQKTSIDLVFDLLHRDPTFPDKTAARDGCTRLMGLHRSLNYAPTGSPTYAASEAAIGWASDRSHRRTSSALRSGGNTG